MTDSLDTSPTAFEAEDADLRAQQREANKVTRWMLVAAIPFVLMFAGLIFAFWWSLQHPSTPATPAPVVATAPAPAAVDKDAEIASLRSQLLALQGQAGPTATPGTPVYSADPAALAQLTARVDRIEASQRALARTAAAANAALALQHAAQGDAPFLAQLAVVEATVDDPAAIALLRPYAEKGVPSEVSLAVEFPTVAAKANIAGKQGKGDNLLGKILHTIGISVRHTDNIDGEGAEANLQRAETRLNVGDLHGAVNYLTKLSPAAQAAIKPWLDSAQARLSVDDATQRLTEGALTRLSQGDIAPVAGGAL